MKKKYFLFIFAVLCSNVCFSQKTLTIHFPDSINEKEVTIHYSIHDILNYFYEPYKDKKKGSDSYFSFTIPDSIPTFLVVMSSTSNYAWSKNMIIPMKKGQKLDIFIDSINDPYFVGNHASFYDYLFKLKKGTGTERTMNTINEFIDELQIPFYEFLNNKIETGILYLDKLLENKEIDEKMHKIGTELTVDEYLYRATLPVNSLDSKIDSLHYISDLEKIIEKHDGIFRWSISNQQVSGLRSQSIVSGTFLDLGLDYSDNSLGYLDIKNQEKEFASNLITETSVGLVSNEQLEKRRETYKKSFPNSIYNKVLDNLKTLSEKDHILAYYSKEKGFEEFGKLEIDNFNPFLNMLFYDQPLLIDFWATWCSPCLKEFDYRNDLEIFLKENNIGMLFVSVDFPGAYDQWINAIKKNGLEGIHFFGTNKFINKLPYFEKNRGIPRYILLDKDGSVLIEACEYPSSGKLIPQIKEALGK